MGNPFIVKGSTIKLGSGEEELKAVVIDDYDVGVGQATQEKDTATDGTSYSYSGEDEDSNLVLPVLLTDDKFIPMMNEIYGAATLTTPLGIPTRTWDLKAAGTADTALEIASPETSDSNIVKWVAVNPKGLGIAPTSNKGKGFSANLSFACDYWQAVYTGTPL